MMTFLGRLLRRKDHSGRRDQHTGPTAHTATGPGNFARRPTFDPAFGDPAEAKLRRQLEGGDTRGLELILSSVRDPDERFFYVDRLSKWAQPPSWSGAWLKRSPKSAAAHLMAGAYLIHFAWQARGTADASAVPKDAWAKFFERLECADEMLRIAAQLDPADAAPWAMLLISARGLQLEPDEKRSRFEEARRRAPLHRAAHSQMLQNLCEKWGGSHEQMFGFARGACASAPPGSPIHVLIAEAHVERWLGFDDTGAQAAYFKNPGVREELARASVVRFGNSNGAQPIQPDQPGAPGQPAKYEDLRAHNYFAFCAWRADDTAAAHDHFSATRNWVNEYPWALLGSPADVFTRAMHATGTSAARAA